MPSTPVSPRELRKQEIRSRILDASIALITEKGFEQTTIEDICQRASVARRTLYRHFETKQDIIDELSRSLLIDDLADKAYFALEQHQCARERLHALFDLIRQPFLPENQHAKALFVQLIHEITPSRQPSTHNQHLRQLNESFTSFFANCAERGELKPGVDPVFYGEMLVSMVIGTVYNWMHNSDYPALARCDALEALIADTALR